MSYTSCNTFGASYIELSQTSIASVALATTRLLIACYECSKSTSLPTCLGMANAVFYQTALLRLMVW